MIIAEQRSAKRALPDAMIIGEYAFYIETGAGRRRHLSGESGSRDITI